MKAENVSHVDNYIRQAAEAYRPLLQELRSLILETAPAGTQETIAYQMPTFRYNGNLIHFALFSRHLGIYPGPGAIEAFAEDLLPYKTSRGTIQLPLDQPLPKELLRKIIRFNADQLKDKESPGWHKYKDQWKEAYEIMQQIVNKTVLKKEFKWGNDIYTFQGKNIVGWAGFKDFFSVWFYNGVFLEDKEKVLITASEGKTKALRQWRFTDISRMDEAKIMAYILESVQTVKDGKEIRPERSAPPAPEGILLKKLELDQDFREAFDRLTPGKQKEYTEYIREAKQEKTQLARLEKIKPLILEGKGLHDKYRR